MMMYMALAAFAAGATAGIFLAFRHFVRKRLPVWVALAHGVGGATGFTLVLWIVVRDPGFWLMRQALYLFIATIAFGCVNLLFHVRKVRHRTSLILMHGLCAVSGVSTLIYAIATHVPTAEAQAEPVPAAELVQPRATEPAVALPATPASSEPVVDSATRRALESSVSFGTNSAGILPSSRQVIASVASVLKAHPELLLVEVQGHADERGDGEHNLELTRARAAAVVDALVASGVAPERLRSTGYGSRCPADPTCRAGDRPKNCHAVSHWDADRRVVFLVVRPSVRGEVAPCGPEGSRAE